LKNQDLKNQDLKSQDLSAKDQHAQAKSQRPRAILLHVQAASSLKGSLAALGTEAKNQPENIVPG
jgi:hypothetical protein